MTESTGKAPDAAADALAATMLSEVSAELSHADDKASLLIGSLGIALRSC